MPGIGVVGVCRNQMGKVVSKTPSEEGKAHGKLRRRIFSDKKSLEWLQSITLSVYFSCQMLQGQVPSPLPGPVQGTQDLKNSQVFPSHCGAAKGILNCNGLVLSAFLNANNEP